MKAKQLREQNNTDLEGKLKDLKKEMLKIKSQVASGAAPKNAGHIKRARRTVARIKTIQNERRKEKKQ